MGLHIPMLIASVILTVYIYLLIIFIVFVWFHGVVVQTPALQAESPGFYSMRNHIYLIAPPVDLYKSYTLLSYKHFDLSPLTIYEKCTSTLCSSSGYQQ